MHTKILSSFCHSSAGHLKRPRWKSCNDSVPPPVSAFSNLFPSFPPSCSSLPHHGGGNEIISTADRMENGYDPRWKGKGGRNIIIHRKPNSYYTFMIMFLPK